MGVGGFSESLGGLTEDMPGGIEGGVVGDGWEMDRGGAFEESSEDPSGRRRANGGRIGMASRGSQGGRND